MTAGPGIIAVSLAATAAAFGTGFVLRNLLLLRAVIAARRQARKQAKPL